MIRVLVVDDQPVIVNGFQLMLSAEPDIEVVGTASDGLSAMQQAGALHPDVVLMDIRMPGIDGITATREILLRGDAEAILMITTFDDEEYLRASVTAGASGFLLKNAGADLLAAAVRSAARGDALIDPAMTRVLLAQHPGSLANNEIGLDYTRRLDSLSERELQVLTHVARGLSNTEIGLQLYLSDATIKTHVANIFTKIGARNRVGAVLFAYESGFLKPHWSTRSEHQIHARNR